MSVTHSTASKDLATNAVVDQLDVRGAQVDGHWNAGDQHVRRRAVAARIAAVKLSNGLIEDDDRRVVGRRDVFVGNERHGAGF